jgi:hypothetical protein
LKLSRVVIDCTKINANAALRQEITKLRRRAEAADHGKKWVPIESN